MQKIHYGSSNEEADNIGHWPDTAKKIDDVNIPAIDALIEIGIAQNFDEARSNAGAKQNQGPQNHAF